MTLQVHQVHSNHSDVQCFLSFSQALPIGGGLVGQDQAREVSPLAPSRLTTLIQSILDVKLYQSTDCLIQSLGYIIDRELALLLI